MTNCVRDCRSVALMGEKSTPESSSRTEASSERKRPMRSPLRSQTNDSRQSGRHGGGDRFERSYVLNVHGSHASAKGSK